MGAGGPMRHEGKGGGGGPYGKGGGKGGRGGKGGGPPQMGGRWGGGTGAGGRGRFERAKNDYAQHFVDTGLRPANFIRDSDVEERFEEYPKLKELIGAKDAKVTERATPPTYKKVDLKTFDLTTLGTKFDVVLIDPPWEEYRRRAIAAGGLEDEEDTEIWSVRLVERAVRPGRGPRLPGPVWRPRPLLRTPERRLSGLEARRGPNSPPRAVPKPTPLPLRPPGARQDRRDPLPQPQPEPAGLTSGIEPRGIPDATSCGLWAAGATWLRCA